MLKLGLSADRSTFKEMSETVKHISGLSPRARFTGVIYLLYFFLAISASRLGSPKLVVYSYVVNALAICCYVMLTLLLYYLFKPVNRPLSLIAAIFSFLGCVVTVLGILGAAPPPYALAFFGPFCLLLGYLILRSTFLPRIFGVLLMLAGIGWLVYLTPLEPYLSLYIKILGILAEGALMLWLIIMGVNIQRWKEQAGQKNSFPQPGEEFEK
jgi:hypothetical protein